MEKILIRPSMIPPATELYFGEGVLERDLMAKLCKNHRAVIVADHSVVERAKTVDGELIAIGTAKDKKTLEYLEEALFRMGCGRDTMLIAMGGGAITDLVGFAASTYMRGVPLIFIPTTLLGMVDASIGGKTAIDTPFGKNLIGTNYFPKAILADYELLSTLPEGEWLNGLAEILKMGLISDGSIWEMAKKDPKSQELILKGMKGKISIVEQDPTEKGMRRVLNFGHTIGHALELIGDYEMPHGEAVAIGSLAEAHLSMSLGYLSEAEFEKVREGYRGFSLELPQGYERKKLIEGMAHDKKKTGGKVRFVLIDRIGHAIPFEGEYCRPVSEQELESTLSWMESCSK